MGWWVDGWMVGVTQGGFGLVVEGWVGGLGCVGGLSLVVCGWVDGWMGEWKEGWMDGGLDPEFVGGLGWTDGKIEWVGGRMN